MRFKRGTNRLSIRLPTTNTLITMIVVISFCMCSFLFMIIFMFPSFEIPQTVEKSNAASLYNEQKPKPKVNNYVTIVIINNNSDPSAVL